MSNPTCSNCNSHKVIKKGCKLHANGKLRQQYFCRNCNKWFLSKDSIVHTQAEIIEQEHDPFTLIDDTIVPPCPFCQSQKVGTKGWAYYRNGRKQRKFLCKNCGKHFRQKSMRFKSDLAEVDCPNCNSSNTVKRGKIIQRLYGEAQLCFCRDCGYRFTDGKRKKMFSLYIKNKLIGRFPVTMLQNYCPDIVCPKCKEYKAFFQLDYIDSFSKNINKTKVYFCFECGHKFKFKGDSCLWNTSLKRRMNEKIQQKVWNFEENEWDIRVLYPTYDEHDFPQLFIYFNDYKFKELKDFLKEYTIHIINNGSRPKTIFAKVRIIKLFFLFLDRQNIKSFNEISRVLLAIYWHEEFSRNKEATLILHMCELKMFFNWLIQEKEIDIFPALITSFDYPKIYKNDPDPLEDCVLEAIRNNIHILPEPLQLQFMLGFWLGARPGELSKLLKDCVHLDQDGSTWWLEFKRHKSDDEHRLPITTDLVKLIQKQQEYIINLFGQDYLYLFCHYRGLNESDYPQYINLEPVRRFPMPTANCSPMVKAINHLIKFCQIKDSNLEEVSFFGKILRTTRASGLIRNGYSLEFVRIWLKHRSAKTTYQSYIRYRPGELLDVATVMANLDNKYYPYDSNPEAIYELLQNLRQNPELHELDGLTTIGGVPLIGYCLFRDFCPRFGYCYSCGFHVASSDKLSLYKKQLDKLKIKEKEVFNFGSSEILESYQNIINRLEMIIEALEFPKESQHE